MSVFFVFCFLYSIFCFLYSIFVFCILIPMKVNEKVKGYYQSRIK